MPSPIYGFLLPPSLKFFSVVTVKSCVLEMTVKLQNEQSENTITGRSFSADYYPPTYFTRD